MKLSKLIVLASLLCLVSSHSTSAYQLNLPFTNSDGDLSNLNIYSGSYLLVDTFATWCEACRLAMDHLMEVNDIVGDQIKIISLSVDDTDTVKKISDYQKEFSAPWDFGLDYQSTFLHIYPVIEYPTAYFFSPEGEVLRSWSGVTTTSKFLNDMGEFIEVPEDYKVEEDFNLYINHMISNPLFIITGIMIVFIVSYNLYNKSRRKALGLEN